MIFVYFSLSLKATLEQQTPSLTCCFKDHGQQLEMPRMRIDLPHRFRTDVLSRVDHWVTHKPPHIEYRCINQCCALVLDCPNGDFQDLKGEGCFVQHKTTHTGEEKYYTCYLWQLCGRFALNDIQKKHHPSTLEHKYFGIWKAVAKKLKEKNDIAKFLSKNTNPAICLSKKMAEQIRLSDYCVTNENQEQFFNSNLCINERLVKYLVSQVLPENSFYVVNLTNAKSGNYTKALYAIHEQFTDKSIFIFKQPKTQRNIKNNIGELEWRGLAAAYSMLLVPIKTPGLTINFAWHETMYRFCMPDRTMEYALLLHTAPGVSLLDYPNKHLRFWQILGQIFGTVHQEFWESSTHHALRYDVNPANIFIKVSGEKTKVTFIDLESIGEGVLSGYYYRAASVIEQYFGWHRIPTLRFWPFLCQRLSKDEYFNAFKKSYLGCFLKPYRTAVEKDIFSHYPPTQ